MQGMPQPDMIDEKTVRKIVEEEFHRLVKDNPNGQGDSIYDRLQALEDRLERIEEHLRA